MAAVVLAAAVGAAAAVGTVGAAAAAGAVGAAAAAAAVDAATAAAVVVSSVGHFDWIAPSASAQGFAEPSGGVGSHGRRSGVRHHSPNR